jgi:diguanylate cyclase (GGDEF)-like protein
MAVFFQWKIADDALRYSRLQTEYQKAMDDYRERNIYYTPATTVQWIVNRQNPAGYFVPNPDMLFEPSQLNDSTLRGTRYAISTLRDLGALQSINRRAVAQYVMSLYQPDIAWRKPDVAEASENLRYAGFVTLPGETAGVRPTMDALIILASLGMLDDPRLDLDRIWNFIAGHQNRDGGFWDEHYPGFGRESSMKATSFAARALGILHRHMKRSFSVDMLARARGFVRAMRDGENGGYRARKGVPASDSYNSFRAFITLLEIANGDEAGQRQAVRDSLDMDKLVDGLLTHYYLADVGAFSRYRSAERKKPSLKATHLIVWMLGEMGYLGQLDIHAISKYVMSLQSANGQYGGDIYTTYSAIGLLRKLGLPTEPLPAPRKPEKPGSIPGYVPAAFFLAALMVLLVGHQAKKMELQNINKALSIQASVDGLTGVYNRQKFEALLKEKHQGFVRYRHPMSLVMFDVDNFKSINDERGHLFGDQILKEITSVIREALRTTDIFARWGGEEFIILLPETDRPGAYQLAQKLRQLLENSIFPEGQRVTASFGVTELLEDDDTDDFVERADMAMLFAKAQGKNQVYSVVSDVQAELMSTTCA